MKCQCQGISHPKTYSVRIINKVVEKLNQEENNTQTRSFSYIILFLFFTWNNFHKVTEKYKKMRWSEHQHKKTARKPIRILNVMKSAKR